jgi:hypothetical protein
MLHIQSGYPMNMEIYPKRSSSIIRCKKIKNTS